MATKFGKHKSFWISIRLHHDKCLQELFKEAEVLMIKERMHEIAITYTIATKPDGNPHKMTSRPGNVPKKSKHTARDVSTQ